MCFRVVLSDERRDALEVQALRAQCIGLLGEERRNRVQLGEVQAHRRAPEVVYAFACVLEGDLQREMDRARHVSQEARTERDITDRHETESRLLKIKARNMEGVASTIQAVVS